jgi:AraC-like DNA-binding protein
MGALNLVLLGLAIGAMLANVLGIWRAPRSAARWTGTIFFLSVAAFAVIVAQTVPGLPTPRSPLLVMLDLPLNLLAFGTVGWFWLCVQTLFDDAKVQPWRLAVVGALIANGLAAEYSPADVAPWIAIAGNVVQAGLLVHAMLAVWRGWKSDLVETRRRLRGPFLMVVTIYTLTMRGLDTVWAFGSTPAWYFDLNAITLAMICLASTWAFLQPRPDLFGAPRPAARAANTPGSERAALDRAALDRAAKADLDRLDALMMRQEIWREEGLTIASLAVRVNIPEAHLRRLINDQLGYRNFPSFVNGHRVAAAKARLSDPGEARTSISAIAFDLGFGSLGPFNRAFKEETGVSPSEWRRKSFGAPDDAAGPAGDEEIA